MDRHIELLLLRMWASYGLRATPEEPVTEAVIIFDMDGYSARQLASVQCKPQKVQYAAQLYN